LQPVVVPVRQQVPGQVGQTHRINSAGRDLRPTEAAGEGHETADINIYADVELEIRWRSSDQPRIVRPDDSSWRPLEADQLAGNEHHALELNSRFSVRAVVQHPRSYYLLVMEAEAAS
jgi:hypothetical protein